MMKNVDIQIYKQPDKMISYWKHQPLTISLIVVFGLAFNILAVYGSIELGKLIDLIVISSGPAMIWKGIMRFVLVILMIQALRYVKRFYIRRFANRTLASMRAHLYNGILNQRYNENNMDTGNLLSRVIGDAQACVEGMRKFTTELFDTGVLMIAYIVTMFRYDLWITLLSVAFVPVAMGIAEKLKTVIVKASSAYRKQTANVTSLTLEACDHALLYRISSVDPIVERNYAKELESLRNKAVKANVLENSMQPLYNAIAMSGIVFVFVLGGQKVTDGIWTLGTFSAYVSIFTALSLKSSKAAKLFNSVQKSSVSWERIKGYLKPYVEFEEVEGKMEEEITVKVSQLRFGYDEIEIFQDLSFTLTSGETMVITGPIASGKSSLLKVLTGVLEYQGSILINGKELRNMSDKERSALISYLPQSPKLFGESLSDNITWESGGNVEEVIRVVQLDNEINAMGQKEETLAGSMGSRFSGGQKARIALARTLYGQRSILLLDDPFASVDLMTERKIIQAIHEYYPKSVLIRVSQRVQTFGEVDKVLYLDSSETLVGTHEELLKQSDRYRAIVELQEGGDDEH